MPVMMIGLICQLYMSGKVKEKKEDLKDKIHYF